MHGGLAYRKSCYQSDVTYNVCTARQEGGGGGRGVCTARDPPARLTRSIFNFASFAGDRFDYVVVTLLS